MNNISLVRGDKVTLRNGRNGTYIGELRSFSPDKMYAVVAWDYGRALPTFRTHHVSDLEKAE